MLLNRFVGSLYIVSYSVGLVQRTGHECMTTGQDCRLIVAPLLDWCRGSCTRFDDNKCEMGYWVPFQIDAAIKGVYSGLFTLDLLGG